MGSSQRELARALSVRESKTAQAQASTVTVLRPDANGNLVEVESIAPVFIKPSAKPRRRKVPKGAKSLL